MVAAKWANNIFFKQLIIFKISSPPHAIETFPLFSLTPWHWSNNPKHTPTQIFFMKFTYLKRSFLFRKILLKEWQHYTEVETNVMVGIYIMNETGERCSCNTLFAHLSAVHRTPYKKTLLATLRKFKQDGVIRVTSKGPGTKIHLTMDGTLYLLNLERRIRNIK